MKNETSFFTRPSRPILFCFRIIFLIFSRLPQFRLLPECRHPKSSPDPLPSSHCYPVRKQTDKHSAIRPADKVLLFNRHIRNSRIALQKVCLRISHSSTISRTVISSIVFFANNVVNAVEISTFVRSFIAFPPPQ